MEHYENAKAEQERLMVILKRNYKLLTGFDGVTGSGIGLRTKNGRFSEEVCIYIEVAKKLPLDVLQTDQIIPDSVEGIHVDVVEQTKKEERVLKIKPSELVFPEKIRPLEGGAQVTNGIENVLGLISVGTLGAMVYESESSGDAAGFISNHHVLYADGAGDGHNIYQPTSSNDNLIGTNYGSKVIGGSSFREVDFAVAVISKNVEYTNNVRGIGELTGISDAWVNIRVRKFGRTTGLTVGTVVKVGFVIIDDKYVPTGLEIVNGYQPIDYSGAFSGSGDSGSVIVDDHSKVVGLLWGGTDVLGYDLTYANDIGRILMAVGKFTIPVPKKAFDPLLFKNEQRIQSFHEVLKGSSFGKEILEKFLVFNAEGRRLVAENRECMVTWIRNKGPQFVDLRVKKGSNAPYVLHKEIDGIKFETLFDEMVRVFKSNGSKEFNEGIDKHGAQLREILLASDTVEEVIAKLAKC